MDGWVIGRHAESQRRFDLPEKVTEATGIDGYVTLRPLTDAEALERESAGIEEWYYLDGQEPAVRRTYDLRAMAEYDYRHCIVDFRLPMQEQDEIIAVEMPPDTERMMEILRSMPPKLADWLAGCIAEVNMRTAEGQSVITRAKKN